jgi:NAD(P)-dependent dehydrogenase (short-subunit alcohol dehydrogenase family)
VVSLKEQVAVVTGGGRGIGRAIALSLADAGAGAGCAAEIEREKLYPLRIRRLGTEQPNPALAAIRAEAERARE